MVSSVIQSTDKVIIADIPRLQWGLHRDNTFIRSSQFALQRLGDQYTYDYLMGISGTAFRTHFHPDFCPSSVDATVGFDAAKILFKVLGIQCKAELVDTNSFMDIRNFFQKVVKQINQGIPVIAINLKVSPDWGLITGYYKKVPGILCRTYYDQTIEYSDSERAPWASFFISKQKKQSIDPKSIFFKSLERASTLGKTKKYEEYFNGLTAFNNWMQALEKVKNSERKKEFYEKMHGNNIIFHFLFDARLAASEYLESSPYIKLMPHAEQVLKIYRNVVAFMEYAIKNILPPLGEKKFEWTLDQIDREIEVISNIMQLEKEAIRFIDSDLQYIGK